jgi:alpha/beta hydrolase fold
MPRRRRSPWWSPLLLLIACTGAPSSQPRVDASPTYGTADIGGYKLAYSCAGSGSPTVVLEAGYAASGVDTYSSLILPAISRTTRVCTYDRAGDGASDRRPRTVTPVTTATQANELHTLLGAIGVGPPYVLVGHSYGGMVVRGFAAEHPSEVDGMVLIDSSSEPEIRVYERLHAGPWIDGNPAEPNQRIDIHASAHELEHAPPIASMPLVVITAGVLQDRWLRTVPRLEARAQTRLAELSSNSIHVLDRGTGHLIPDDDPGIVLDATDAVVSAARSSGELTACATAFSEIASARCIRPGGLARQRIP